MANINLSGMTVEALMDLRKRVDEMLLERRAELKKQLERMGALRKRASRSSTGASVLKILRNANAPIGVVTSRQTHRPFMRLLGSDAGRR